MTREPSNDIALEEVRRLQISEHVEKRELSCEAERLRASEEGMLMECTWERDIRDDVHIFEARLGSKSWVAVDQGDYLYVN